MMIKTEWGTGGMTGEQTRGLRKSCPTSTLSTTNPIQTVLRFNLDLIQGEFLYSESNWRHFGHKANMLQSSIYS
jgi:hypothetical protein